MIELPPKERGPRLDAIPQSVGGEGKMLMDRMQTMAAIVEQESGHWLMQFNAEKLERLKRIDAIVVVGPSGAGKSTTIDAAREWTQSVRNIGGRFVVPMRVLTRPKRLGDNLRENKFARTPEEFEEMTRGGIQWTRKMDLKAAGRVERYGFEAVPQNTIPIYSANNAFLSPDANLIGVSLDFNDHALVMCVYARPHIRVDRLMARSPDVMAAKPEEAAMRLAPMEPYVLERSHITLRTRDVEKERSLAPEVMSNLLTTIVEIKEARSS